MTAFEDGADGAGTGRRSSMSRRSLLAGLGVAAVGFSLQACGKGGGDAGGDKLIFYT